MKLLFSVLATAIFFTPIASASNAASDIIGITIGAELALPQCPLDTQAAALAKKIHVSGLLPTYSYNTEQICWKHNSIYDVGKPLTDSNSTLDVYVPFAKSPTGIASVSIRLKNKIVQSMELYTTGIKSQNSVLALLTEKYGQAQSVDHVTLSNMFGAEVDSIVARWNFDNIVIDFSGAIGAINKGLITVQTVESAKRAEAASEDRNRVKL